MTTKVIAYDRIYVPEDKVDVKEVERIFIQDVYLEEKCEPCEYFEDRHCDVCDTCPNFIGTFKLYNEKEIKGKNYLGLPSGYRSKIKKVLIDKDIKVKDKRSTPKFKHKIKFKGKERDYQKPARKDMVKAGYGILEAPPRSGKTVMGTAIVCKIGYKTLILASQHDWLVNFYETIVGSEEKKLPPMTNVPDIQEDLGHDIVGFPKTLKEFKQYDICLCTYQMFNSKKGVKLYKKIRKMFGTIMLDECLPKDTVVLTVDNDGNYVEKTIYDCVNDETINKVVSFNHETGEVEAKTIESRNTVVNDLLEIETDEGTIRCSPHHRFWSKTRNSYVFAEDLEDDEEFLTLDSI